MLNQLANHQYRLDESLVLHFMGYSTADQVREPILATVREQITSTRLFADQWGSSVEAPVTVIRNDEVVLQRNEDKVALKSNQLPKVLRHCDAVAILLVTAGDEISREARRVQSEDPLTAFILDAIGSAMVVELMQSLTGQVFTEAQQRGYGTTLRLGPGYTGWHIDDQALLYSYFNAESIPVSFESGTMMKPEKTLIGLLGLRPNGKEAPEIEPCRVCDLADCRLRRSPFRGIP